MARIAGIDLPKNKKRRNWSDLYFWYWPFNYFSISLPKLVLTLTKK